MRKLSLIGAALFAFVGAASAAPNPATATFQVSIQIQAACSVTAANINFLTQDSSATGLSATNNLSVICSRTTPYRIGLIPAGGNTVGSGTMKSATPVTNTDTVPYQLRSVSATGPVWGSILGTNTVAGTGTGLAQSVPVFATIPGNGANVAPDTYTDTVTVNVTY